MSLEWLQANGPQLVDQVFLGLLIGLAVLHLLVYAVPLRMVRINALPWAFRLDFNADLDFQTVTYAAVHESWPARYSHLTLPLELVAWNALLWMWHPAALVASTLLTMALQLRGEEKRFGRLAGVVAVAVAAASAGLVEAVGPEAIALPAKALLLIGPVLRFLGHTFDPIPPWVGHEGDVFLPLAKAKMGVRFPAVVFVALLSESAASLPYRLFWVQLFWLTQKLGLTPQTLRPWSEANAIGAAIRTNGWKAFPKVGRLLEPMVPRS